MAKFMKVLAVLTLVFGVVGGIVLGAMHQVLVAPEYSFQEATLGFNWEIMITTWAYSIVLFGVLYSIGRIIELLENISGASTVVVPASNLPMYASMMQPEAGGNTSESVSAPKPSQFGYVVCKKCGEENKPFELYCGKCGNKL